jgi:hypothetical protein
MGMVRLMILAHVFTKRGASQLANRSGDFEGEIVVLAVETPARPL